MSAAADPLHAKLPAHDCRILASLVAHTLKTREAPNWRAAWGKLSDLGRHVLLRANAAEIFDCALSCWAASPRFAMERLTRRATLGSLRRNHGDQAMREIEAGIVALKAANAKAAEQAEAGAA